MHSYSNRTRRIGGVAALISSAFVGLAAQLMPSGANARSDPPEHRTNPAAVDHDSLNDIREGKLVLKRGAKGASVRAIQTLLGIKADGDYGEKTEGAVRKFQAEYQLKPDGKVGKNTLGVLEHARAVGIGDTTPNIDSEFQSAELPSLRQAHGAENAKPLHYVTLKSGDQGEVVKVLKEALNKLGYQPKLNSNNPVYDQLTENAVRKFQDDTIKRYPHLKGEYRDKPTGVVTPTTWYWLDVALEKSGSVFDAPRQYMRNLFGEQSPPIAIANRSTFERALKYTLGIEGGTNADPHDRGNRGGNVTKHGLTQPAVNAYCREIGIPRLDLRRQDPSPEFVRNFYYRQYWQACENMQLAECLAISYFDCRVLFGHKGAACLLQRALGVPSDGKFGKASIEALRAQDPVAVTMALSVEAQKLVDVLVAKHKENPRYRDGWSRRAYERSLASGIFPSPRAPLMATSSKLDRCAPLTAADMRALIADEQKSRGLTTTGEVDVALFNLLMGSK